MKDMTFTCDSQLPVTSYNVSNAIYNEVSGIMTVTTTVDNNFYVGASVTFAQLTFNCDSGGGVGHPMEYSHRKITAITTVMRKTCI